MGEPKEFYFQCGNCAGCDESCPDYDSNWIIAGPAMTATEEVEVWAIMRG